MERHSSTSATATVTTSSTFKWFVLVTFLLGSLSNGIAWLTFAPVPFETAAYYGISVNQVDIFSIIFMLVSIPVGILCIYLVDRIGLRYSLYGAMISNTLGTLLRWVTLFHDGTEITNCADDNNGTENGDNAWLCPAPAWSYNVALVATVITAVAQPIVLITPTKLAAQWFPAKQRLLANGIASLANPVGSTVASLLAPIICHSPGDLVYMQGYFLIPTILSLVMMFCICKEGHFPSAKYMPMKELCHSLFFNGQTTKSYLLISFLIMYNVALVSAVLTLSVQILCSTGYENTFSSSICMPSMIGMGLLVSVGLSFLIDGTRRHVVALKIILAFEIVGIIGFTIAMMYPNNEAVILISLIVFGGAGLAAVPLMNELVVESTYPVGEATSTGFAMIASQALAAMFVLLSLIPPTGYAPDTSICPEDQGQNFFWYMMSLNAVLLMFYPFFLYFYQCDFKRLAATESIKKSEYITQTQSL